MKIPDPRIQPPGFIRDLFPSAIWRFTAEKPEVYLTFDDGPIPEATPWILELLDKEKCGASFFCVGENALRHNQIYREILAAGHTTGNHTYNHLQGVKTSNPVYFNNIALASGIIESALFRPPHGWMKYSQYRWISGHYKIIFWDVVSRDYHPKVSPTGIVRYVNDYVRNGSVIAFHDSLKTIEKLKIALPVVIKMLKDKGFQPVAIPEFKPIDIHLYPDYNRN